MKYLFLGNFICSITLFCVSNTAYCQDPYPAGCYMSLEELIKREPSQHYDAFTTKRTAGEIAMVGGNEYKLEPFEESVKPKILKKKVWAYSDGRQLYLNGRHHGLQTWYCKVLDHGYYLVFTACMDNGSAAALGFAGGAIAAAATSGITKVYVLNLEEKQVKQVDKHNLANTLEDYPDLLERYEEEKGRGSDDILLRYVMMLNQRKTAEMNAVSE
ncbi:MAG: DUF6563 family protein [Flavobacteriales bacterium]